VIQCDICSATAGRVELRCEYIDGAIVRTQVVADIGAARELASSWLEAVREKGSFTELPTDDGPVQKS
jgi:hypothetical protein